ncbi:hypothetical protein ACP70R_040973 [Stipagrostis hirtigluma subsp. patula]
MRGCLANGEDGGGEAAVWARAANEGSWWIKMYSPVFDAPCAAGDIASGGCTWPSGHGPHHQATFPRQ